MTPAERDALREKVARVLCMADGTDPESVCYRLREGGGHETIRRWMKYTHKASAILALIEKKE